ncbi:DUF6090 family protein [Flavobacteriaceae bacterium D16]|nr:DUF6090 family protein [Flavobacteriaceae bacterium D16]
MSENKTGIYFKYALGEIILVVLGILIALQINNWNEARKEDKALKEYLVKIKSHTLEDLEKLDQISAGRALIAENCKKARKHMLDKTEDQNPFVFMSAAVAFADFYFKPNTGGYDALKNSEYFGRINNTPLDSLLSRYHNLVAEIAQNESSYNEYVVYQEVNLDTRFDRSLILASAFMSPDSLSLRATPQAEYDQAFQEFFTTPAYRNVISLAAWNFDTMISQYNQLKEAGQTVIKEVDVLIKK